MWHGSMFERLRDKSSKEGDTYTVARDKFYTLGQSTAIVLDVLLRTLDRAGWQAAVSEGSQEFLSRTCLSVNVEHSIYTIRTGPVE